MSPGGRLLLAVPSNPREWRWDDDFYGHVRRYTVEDLRTRLEEAGLEAVTFEDFTFPVYWAMRRAYTRLKRAPPPPADAHAATMASATRNAWDLSFVSRIADRSAALWTPPPPPPPPVPRPAAPGVSIAAADRSRASPGASRSGGRRSRRSPRSARSAPPPKGGPRSRGGPSIAEVPPKRAERASPQRGPRSRGGPSIAVVPPKRA
ncbi:MAG: hypothetical protein IPG84_14805 [Betaproteobacteria bacterium]|nr:hypothetical protein [Betaproteobacteria bacterium]